MQSFKQHLTEGVNDKAIFKAIFLAGGPGSGKSTTLKYAGLNAIGFKSINSDSFFEKALKDAGLDANNPDHIASDKAQELRSQSKKLTKKQMEIAIAGRLGLVIDGTGARFDEVKQQAIALKRIGYEVGMVFVNTSLETAIARQVTRGQKGGRNLDPELVKQNWQAVQNNLSDFSAFFKPANFFIIDNNKGEKELRINTTPAYKQIKAWADKEPTAPQAKAWMWAAKEKK